LEGLGEDHRQRRLEALVASSRRPAIGAGQIAQEYRSVDFFKILVAFDLGSAIVVDDLGRRTGRAYAARHESIVDFLRPAVNDACLTINHPA
jgi:hypothetical protein